MDGNNILDAGFEQGGIHINGQSTAYLKEIVKWTNFLSIVGFILLGFMTIGLVYMMVMLGTIASPDGVASVIIFGIFLMLSIYPILKLFNFSKEAKSAFSSNSSEHMSLAFSELKSLFKFIGIVTIVILVVYGGLILFGGAAAIIGLGGGF